MLVLSSSFVLTEVDQVDGTPWIGYRNLVTISNVTADASEPNFPASNLANPLTHVEWRSPHAGPMEISFAVNSLDPIDYLGAARHNFGSTGATLEVGYYDTSSPPAWVNLAGPQIVADDAPILFAWTAQSLATVVLRITPVTTAPRLAVVYVGKLLVLERGVVPDEDFAVPNFARRTTAVNGRSESGDYLGRIVSGQILEFSVKFAHGDPDWYRANFAPFVIAAQDDTPFFYVWAPDDYPDEVAYAWFTDDPIPLTNPVTRRNAFELKCGGIVA